jgi:hypothetical protein
MNRRLQKVVQLGRAAVVLLVIGAMIASGASSATRLFPVDQSMDSQEDLWLFAELVQGPPAPDEAAGNWSDYGRPNGEPAAYVISPLLKSDGGSRSILREIAATPLPVSLTGGCAADPQPVGTPSLVCSDLGRQFTLVGARPSGTS